ncbi:CRISPR system precrRNA processing endoribonuclease RAMP protein Cas6 [Nocardia salmonicida]|uniref:CRISPR system precrRNA processing endoribonuclease RAMP protein Cas6 n=1 Tax=Nocardia salmonicida TaxID=53431 RepID=UPI00379D4640
METGSNQALVFGTNKQRLNVAASRLIWQVGFEWIPEAIDEVRVALGESIDHVVKASGLGVMLASEDAGRRVIEIVTRRAVLHAPDLQVWGVVGAAELTADTLGAALAAAQRDSHRNAPIAVLSSLGDSGSLGRIRYHCDDPVVAATLRRLLLFAELAGLGRYTTRGLGIITLDSGAGRNPVVSGPRKPPRSVQRSDQRKQHNSDVP